MSTLYDAAEVPALREKVARLEVALANANSLLEMKWHATTTVEEYHMLAAGPEVIERDLTHRAIQELAAALEPALTLTTWRDEHHQGRVFQHSFLVRDLAVRMQQLARVQDMPTDPKGD